jgi:hypothetical protein
MRKYKINWQSLAIESLLISFCMLIVMGGMLCNFLVIKSNHGQMPVYGYDMNTEDHVGFENKNSVDYYYLADIIPMPWIGAMFSIGDIIMFIGGSGVLTLAIVSICNLHK